MTQEVLIKRAIAKKPDLGLTPGRKSRLSVQFPLSSDEEGSPPPGPSRHNDHSQVGSVQKFLTKPVPAVQQDRAEKTTKTHQTKTKRVRVRPTSSSFPRKRPKPSRTRRWA